MGRNGIRDIFVTVIGTPHVDPLFYGFLILEQADARLIKFEKIASSSPLLKSEDIKSIV